MPYEKRIYILSDLYCICSSYMKFYMLGKFVMLQPLRRICVTGVISAVLSLPLIVMAAPDSFAPIAKKAIPSVVSITTTQKLQKQRGSKRMGMPENPFELFEFFERELNPPKETHALGSGFIIDPDGYIVTNHHVIANATEIEVILSNEPEKPYSAKVVGKDLKTDIALLKIEADVKLPAMKFGNSENAQVGDWVLAIGNPLGFGSTVTAGIISAKARHLGISSFGNYIQTDASINGGNSGGALINMKGEVIGINNVIATPSGGSIGIGFAIPSSIAKTVVKQLKNNGRVERGWLGVNVQHVDATIAQGLGLGEPRGALVANVIPGSPAEKSGLKIGDLIVSVNNQDVATMFNLPLMIAELPIGEKVKVKIIRDGRTLMLPLVIEKLEEDDSGQDSPNGANQEGKNRFGIVCKDIDDSNRSQYNIPSDVHGVVITSMARGGQLRRKGIKVGDMIKKVNKIPIKTVNEFYDTMDMLKKKGAKQVVVLCSRHDNSNRFIVLDLGNS